MDTLVKTVQGTTTDAVFPDLPCAGRARRAMAATNVPTTRNETETSREHGSRPHEGEIFDDGDGGPVAGQDLAARQCVLGVEDAAQCYRARSVHAAGRAGPAVARRTARGLSPARARCARFPRRAGGARHAAPPPIRALREHGRD